MNGLTIQMCTNKILIDGKRRDILKYGANTWMPNILTLKTKSNI